MFDLDVVVIGGGIAGLSTALFLKRFGYNVIVYERAPEILPVGAAISVWSNGVKVMNRLGFGKEMIELGGQMDRMIYRSSKGESLVDMDLGPVYKEVGERCYPVPRAELQQMLMDKYVAEGGKLVLGRSCVSVHRVDESDEDSKMYAVFDDGSKSMVCDVLVGADGIRSQVRTHVLEKEMSPVYHYTNWNGLVKMDAKLGKPNEWVMHVGEGKRASVMPVGNGRFYFFMGAPLPEDAPAPERGSEAMRDELKEIFKGWPASVQHLIDAIDVTRLNRIPICDVDPLPRLWRGRAVLVGDSAHSTTPTLGQGGCQALEDAEVLSSFLTTTNVGVQDVFARYEQHRKDRVHTMVLKARERTAQIYPRDAEGEKATQQWYEELRSSKDIGSNILGGITANLKQGPWPPRL
ncbi:Monooxygenase 3 [Hondaea fermentalgiana]|uniref:Monooxygenase 3 n=1 Tax=Hondaea fermentalgiana TaxID=2315210 RepID=A0A2R5GJB6_9STRA|nr:Monooxygenase 3 [Hondaea fermentalgiana]|eukprot:GBG28753.1 Monooxygenase 3 [Hondaea fermentalgiana]